MAPWIQWCVWGLLGLGPEAGPAIEVPPPEPSGASIEVPAPDSAAPVLVPPPEVSVTPSPIASRALGLDLEWRAAPGCPGSDRIVAVTGALLGRDVVLDPTGALIVRGTVTAQGGGWTLELEVDGPGGSERRRLHADACEVLEEAAALVIATNVDPAQVAGALDRAQARGPVVPPAASSPRDRPGTAAPRDGAGRRRIGVALVVVGGPALGVTPKVTGWVQGGMNVSIGRAVIGAHAGHGFARRAEGDATLRAALTTGGVRGCFAPTQGRLAVPLCGLFEAGAVSTRAEGSTTRRARGLWLGAGAGAAVEWSPHPRVALVGGVDALVAILRPGFHVDGPEGTSADYRAAPAAVRATLGISVRLR